MRNPYPNPERGVLQDGLNKGWAEGYAAAVKPGQSEYHITYYSLGKPENSGTMPGPEVNALANSHLLRLQGATAIRVHWH